MLCYTFGMPTTLGIRRRRQLSQLGIGMPGDNSHILNIARRLRELVDAAVIGGIAVFLHGGGRSTVDLDLYASDQKATSEQLKKAGAIWDPGAREYLLDGVRIHLVTPQDTGITISTTSTIDGVRVVTLKDIVAIKLTCGLENPGRHRDIGDVEDLIRAVPLDKRFAARLPKSIRSEFKALVDGVRQGEKRGPENRRF